MILLACVFIQELVIVGSVILKKVIVKVSVNNGLNHGWRTCCCQVAIFVSSVSKTFFIVNIIYCLFDFFMY